MAAEDLLLQPGRTLGVVGAGVMGTAVLQGVLDAGLVSRDQVWASARTQATCDRVAARLGIRTVLDYGEWAATAGIIVVGVKPWQIPLVAERLRDAPIPPDTLLVSLLGGVSNERLESLLPGVWVRAVPNTPCVVGHGMTAVCGGRQAGAKDMETARRIFASVGRCEVVDETYVNAITALSGSGPAYMYLVMEALVDGGVKVGLRRDLALRLVAQTMLGAAKMVQETGRHPASLKDDVTTPGGCTIEGLLTMEDGGVRSALARAVQEATGIVESMGKR
jgi:pyrroline-5-carboxylate reductase